LRPRDPRRKGWPVADRWEWLEAIPGAATVCDASGVIVALNGAAARSFEASGGRGLIGRRLVDCHPEPAREKLEQLLATRATHVYTIEKKGARSLIYQAPWYENGRFGGLIELSLALPAVMPHFVRDSS
jgi:PAS domain-containing protein